MWKLSVIISLGLWNNLTQSSNVFFLRIDITLLLFLKELRLSVAVTVIYTGNPFLITPRCLSLGTEEK